MAANCTLLPVAPVQEGKGFLFKCTCGYERLPESVLCRMMEGADGRFLVEILGPDGRLLAQSAEGLDMHRALDFVESMVDRHSFSTHFHWEEDGKLLMAANASRVLELFGVSR